MQLGLQVRAVQKLRELIAERDILAEHTHGFAYPDCPKCKRERELNDLLGREDAAHGEKET